MTTKKQRLPGRPRHRLGAFLPRVRCSASDLKRWRDAAETDGRSLAQWVRRALNDVAHRERVDQAIRDGSYNR